MKKDKIQVSVEHKTKYIQVKILKSFKIDFFPTPELAPKVQTPLKEFQQQINKFRNIALSITDFKEAITPLLELNESFQNFKQNIPSDIKSLNEHIGFFDEIFKEPQEYIQQISEEFDSKLESGKFKKAIHNRQEEGKLFDGNFHTMPIEEIRHITQPIHSYPQETQDEILSLVRKTQRDNNISAIFVSPGHSITPENFIKFCNNFNKYTRTVAKDTNLNPNFFGIDGLLDLKVIDRFERTVFGCFNDENLNIGLSTEIAFSDSSDKRKSIILHEWMHAIEYATGQNTKKHIQSLINDEKITNTERAYYQGIIDKIEDFPSSGKTIQTLNQNSTIEAYNAFIEMARNLQCENPYQNHNERDNYRINTLTDLWNKTSNTKLHKISKQQQDVLTSNEMFTLIQMHIANYNKNVEVSSSINEIPNRIEKIIIENGIPFTSQEILKVKELKLSKDPEANNTIIQELIQRIEKFNSIEPMNDNFSQMRIGSKSLDELRNRNIPDEYKNYFQKPLEMIARNAETQIYPDITKELIESLKNTMPTPSPERKIAFKEQLDFIINNQFAIKTKEMLFNIQGICDKQANRQLEINIQKVQEDTSQNIKKILK